MTRDPLKIDLSCPVPSQQQPCNEYKDLQESFFFCWGQLPLDKYVKKLLWLGFWSSLLLGPIVAAAFSPLRNFDQFLLAELIGVSLSLGLAILRLYLGWLYIRQRLTAKKVFYEESGWYDGQVWLKPEAIASRDLLIVNYEIEPIMQRLKTTAGILLVVVITSSFVWSALINMPSKP